MSEAVLSLITRCFRMVVSWNRNDSIFRVKETTYISPSNINEDGLKIKVTKHLAFTYKMLISEISYSRILQS